MQEAFWIVTFEERNHKGRQVVDESGSPRVDSITIGPFWDEQKMRDYADKNIKLQHKFYRCQERIREKASKAIKEGRAEEV
jgi:hypothetical protein